MESTRFGTPMLLSHMASAEELRYGSLQAIAADFSPGSAEHEYARRLFEAGWTEIVVRRVAHAPAGMVGQLPEPNEVPQRWEPTIGDDVEAVKLGTHPGEMGTVVRRQHGRLPFVVRWPDGCETGYAAHEIRAIRPLPSGRSTL